MLLLKRLATGIVLFLPLLLVFYIGSLTVGGMIAGAMASTEQQATDFNSGYNVGYTAG